MTYAFCRDILMKEPDFKTSEMVYFDDNHEGEMIKDMARGMSMNEVCDFFGAPPATELQGEDLVFLKYWYKMGRQSGNADAVKALFSQMAQRGGGQVALSYLARFADDWTAEVKADNEQAGKKTFTVVLD